MAGFSSLPVASLAIDHTTNEKKNVVIPLSSLPFADRMASLQHPCHPGCSSDLIHVTPQFPPKPRIWPQNTAWR